MIDEMIVRKVSKLAALALTEEESRSLQKDLSRILEFVSALEKVDTDDVLPLVTPMDLEMVVCNDTIDWDEKPESIFANAPAHKDHLFLVPKVVE